MRFIAGLISEIESNAEAQITPINKKEIEKVISVCDKTITLPNFEKLCSRNPDPSRNMYNLVDWEKSIKLILNKEIIGYYVFSSYTIDNFLKKMKMYGLNIKINEEVYNKIKGKKGVEGVAVGVLDKYKGLGYGKMLLDYPKKLNIDYIWGVQTKGISDINAWAKRREFLATIKAIDGQEFYITIQVFK